MSAFHVGQKVVAIDNTGLEAVLAVGTVYTVRRIEPVPSSPAVGGKFATSKMLAILDETTNTISCVDGFATERFRPLAFPKQSLAHDIAQFLKIADRAPAPKKRAGVRA